MTDETDKPCTLIKDAYHIGNERDANDLASLLKYDLRREPGAEFMVRVERFNPDVSTYYAEQKAEAQARAAEAEEERRTERAVREHVDRTCEAWDITKKRGRIMLRSDKGGTDGQA